MKIRISAFFCTFCFLKFSEFFPANFPTFKQLEVAYLTLVDPKVHATCHFSISEYIFAIFFNCVAYSLLPTPHKMAQNANTNSFFFSTKIWPEGRSGQNQPAAISKKIIQGSHLLSAQRDKLGLKHPPTAVTSSALDFFGSLPDGMSCLPTFHFGLFPFEQRVWVRDRKGAKNQIHKGPGSLMGKTWTTMDTF